MRVVSALAEGFEPVSLDELGASTLMDRVDRKFPVPVLWVPAILEGLSREYRVLEVHGRRLSRYSTRYFDTTDLAMYHAHHSGRARRNKVRVRTYVDSETRFLEVKEKNNRGRTRKARVSLSQDLIDPMSRLERDCILGITRIFPPRELRESVVVDYTRLTLVGRNVAERVTLDLMLSFTRDGQTRSFPGLAVAEVKQERRGHSHFIDALKSLNVREGSLSKYCLGIACLEPSAKKNRFVESLRRIEKIDGDSVPNHI